MIDLDELAVDTKLFEEGKKVEFGEDSHIRIRSAGSTRAQKIREELWKPYATWTDIPKDVLDSLNAQWIAKGLLTEFVGFAADGNLLTFDLSKEEDCERLGLILKAPKYKASGTGSSRSRWTRRISSRPTTRCWKKTPVVRALGVPVARTRRTSSAGLYRRRGESSGSLGQSSRSHHLRRAFLADIQCPEIRP